MLMESDSQQLTSSSKGVLCHLATAMASFWLSLEVGSEVSASQDCDKTPEKKTRQQDKATPQLSSVPKTGRKSDLKTPRGKDKKPRAERGSQQTFAGRRPPKSGELSRIFFACKNGYWAFKKKCPNTLWTQDQVWKHVQAEIKKHKNAKGNEKPEAVVAKALKILEKKHAGGH